MASAGNASTPVAAAYKGLSYKIRSTFYALTPEETYIQNIKDVPDVMLEALPVMMFMVALELVIQKARGDGAKVRLHVIVTNFSTGLLNEAGRIFIFRGLEFSVYIWLYTHYRLLTLSWNSPFTYLLAMLGVDLCNYWWHRLCHEVSFMWAAHYVHHSSEDFNMSVGARISITMRPVKWVYYLPLAFVGLPPSAYLIHSQLGFIWAFWVHIDVWPRMQKVIPVLGHLIEYILVMPSHHRLHHAANKYCIDKNYGTVFIIWDRLFGTFVEEKEGEELVFGTIAQKDNNHFISIQADPWRDLWSRVAAAKTPGDKLRTIMYGPGWSSGQPRLGNIEDIPEVRGRKKHEFAASVWLNFYMTLHIFLLILGLLEMGSRLSQVNKWITFLHVCYIVMASGSLGELYTVHQCFTWLEPVRILLALAMCHLLHVFASPLFIASFTCVHLVSLLVWPTVGTQGLGTAVKKME